MKMNYCLKCLLTLVLCSAAARAETVFVTLEKDNALAVVDPVAGKLLQTVSICLLYTSPSPRDHITSRMPSSA